MIAKWKGSRTLTEFYPLQGDLAELQSILDSQIKDFQADIDKLDVEAKKVMYQNKRINTLAQYKKVIAAAVEQFKTNVAALNVVLSEAKWLTDKFGEGEYRDIPGLCKAATLAEIEEKNYSLTPGAYVGVAEQEDDGVDFSQRMQEIHRELLRLQTESNELMQTISRNMEGLGL